MSNGVLCVVGRWLPVARQTLTTIFIVSSFVYINMNFLKYVPPSTNILPTWCILCKRVSSMWKLCPVYETSFQYVRHLSNMWSIFSVCENIFPICENIFPMCENIFPICENIFPVHAECEDICHIWKDLQSSVQYMFVFDVSEHFYDVRKYLSSGGKHFISV